ncbi:MAG: hypothetical protein HQ478_12380 [Chloroflexi bacterium]|nr:hypothetical protein [Chloroflexota bacterium]
MKKASDVFVYRMLVVAALMTLIFLAACGSSDSGSSPAPTMAPPSATATAQPEPTPTIAPQPTMAPEPTTVPTSAAPKATAAPVATTPPEPTATAAPDVEVPEGGFDKALLAAGKIIFEKTAGGVGCAFCHGLKGEGDGPSGLGAPPNRGKTLALFEEARLNGESGAMEFINLTKEEKIAVFEYVAWLGTQPE